MHKKNIMTRGRTIFIAMITLIISLTFSSIAFAQSEYESDGLREDTGREYGDTFRTLVSGGYLISCYAYGDNEAVVYDAEVGQDGKLVIPDTIYDAVKQKNRKIVGVIARAEVIEEAYSTGLYHYINNPIGSGATIIKDVTFPSTLKFVGQGAFCGLTKLQKVTFKSNSEYTIEGNAFAGCSGLTSVNFNGNGEANVDMMAFKDCTGLKSISFPNNSVVDAHALEGCFNLETIINSPESLYFYSEYSKFGFENNCSKDSDDNYIFKLKKIQYKNGPTEIYGFEQSNLYYQQIKVPYLSEVSFPSTAEYIKGFEETALETVYLPEGIEEIGSFCFYGCDKLRQINLPKSLKYIDYAAFSGCSSLTGISSLPSNIESVEEYAFNGCKSLKMSVNHPGHLEGTEYQYSGITDITFDAYNSRSYDYDYYDWDDPNNLNDGDYKYTWYMLWGCSNLKSINVRGANSYCKSVNGVLYAAFYDEETGKNEWGILRYPPAKSNGSYVIPSDVKYIAAYSFEGCKFSEISIPVTVKGFRNDETYSENDDYPFKRLATKATIWYVKNSYVDTGYYGRHTGWIVGDCSFSLYSPRKQSVGPTIKISYDLGGGKNNPNNPSQMIAGNTIKLKKPTRQGYTFSHWEYKGSYGHYPAEKEEWRYLGESDNQAFTPENIQLVKGAELKAVWKKSSDNSKGSDGTAVGKGASAAVAEKAITSAKNDSDPKGSVFGVLQLKSSKQAKNNITLNWKKVSGAKKYVVYGNACGKNNKMKKLSTLTKNSFKVTKIGKKKLKKGTYHKFIVVALDKNNKVVSTSKIIHVATKGGKVGNNKAVKTKAKKNKISLKKGKVFKLAGKTVPASKLTVKKHTGVRYETSNKKIASVSKKGVVKGLKKGSCKIYAYAQDGVCTTIKVTVK